MASASAMVTVSKPPSLSSGTETVTGSSTEPISPSSMAAPTSSEVIDLVTENSIEGVAASWAGAYHSYTTAPSWTITMASPSLAASTDPIGVAAPSMVTVGSATGAFGHGRGAGEATVGGPGTRGDPTPWRCPG